MKGVATLPATRRERLIWRRPGAEDRIADRKVDQKVDADTLTSGNQGGRTPLFSAAIYLVAFVTGGIVMSFEMLGSRYLNPYFGSGIYTWAALISTVLAALTVGYFLGGWLADRTASVRVLGATVGVASLYMLVLPAFSEALLELVLAAIDDVRTGSLVAAFAVMFFPVTLYGIYSPFAIRLMLRSAARSGVVSGTVYGVSTAGSIVGTLGTTFFLIPAIGTRAITFTLGAAGIVCGLLLIALPRIGRGASVPAALIACAALAAGHARAEALFDQNIRAVMLKRADGRIAHIETQYTDLYIDKERSMLLMSSRYKRDEYVESMVNLKDPDDLPIDYTRSMTVSLAYPQEPRRVAMIGLGGGSISTYLGRHMPELAIDAVEVDPGLIKTAKTYFGIRETEKVRFIENDGRVYLNRNKSQYDVILLDAFQRLGVPFHLLTKEFYQLVKERLAPDGVAAFNVTGGTKLYTSTLVTLRAVFPTVDVYPVYQDKYERQMIAVASAAGSSDPDALMRHATALQTRHKLRFPLPELVKQREDKSAAPGGVLLTDDFAPVNLYEVMPATRKRK
jgi:spermidine synthase